MRKKSESIGKNPSKHQSFFQRHRKLITGMTTTFTLAGLGTGLGLGLSASLPFFGLAAVVTVPLFTVLGFLLGLAIGASAALIYDWTNKPSSDTHFYLPVKLEPVQPKDKAPELVKTEAPQLLSELLRVIAYQLPNNKDLSNMHRTNQFFKKSLQPNLDTRQFLEAVAHGNQDEAERLLKKNLGLMIAKYSVEDYSKRKFPWISGFQYALAALDTRYMTGMMLNCIREDETLTIKEKKDLVQELLKQYKEVEEEGVTYILDGITYHNQKDFGFTPLVTALQAYVDNFAQWSWERKDKHFCTEIGKAQILVPAHLAQHYCEPDVPFDPKPTFTAKTFKRCLEVKNYVTDTVHGWWEAAGNFILGRDFGYVRLRRAAAGRGAWARRPRGGQAAAADLEAVSAIFEIRSEDRLTIRPALNDLIQEFDQVLELLEETSLQPK